MSKKLREQAKKASSHAYAPYSKVKLGTCVEMEDGSLFTGSNIENSSFGATVCAERVAIWKAISEGKKKIKKVYIYSPDGWPPCGMCRQVINEFADEHCLIIMGDEEGNESEKTFRELLPLPHTPDTLL